MSKRKRWLVICGKMRRYGWGCTPTAALRDALRRMVESAAPAKSLASIARVKDQHNRQPEFYCDTVAALKDIGAWRGDP